MKTRPAFTPDQINYIENELFDGLEFATRIRNRPIEQWNEHTIVNLGMQISQLNNKIHVLKGMMGIG